MDRRQFLSSIGKGIGATLVTAGVLAAKPARAQVKWAVNGRPLKIAYATEKTSICPYCGVGCGLLVAVQDGKIINIEGDPTIRLTKAPFAQRAVPFFRSPKTSAAPTRCFIALQKHPSGKRSAGILQSTKSHGISSRLVMKLS